MTGQAFEPRRFRTAAAHYVAGRPAYAARLIRRVVMLTGLTPADDVLDLGCGPGPLAAAFAGFAATVTAVDPEPEMLRIARDAAPANVRFIEGSSYDLGPQWGRFRLVTMGRSFHWMDREETLRRLDGMVEPQGAVALFHDTHPEVPENAFWREFRTLIRRYAPEGETRRDGPGWTRHESVLLDSAFNVLEEISVIERRAVTVEGLVARALSMSTTSEARIGARAGELAAEIRAMMAGVAAFSEVMATQALIATRG